MFVTTNKLPLAGLQGVETVYDQGSTYDYPPLYAYMLAPVGRFYAAIAPQAVESFPATRIYGDSPTFSLLIKLPPLLADILIAFLLGTLAYRFGLWPRGSWRGWLPALLYLALPPVLCDSGYWGQPDAVHTLSLLLAMTLILVGKPELGWIAAALACLMKPLAVPYLPLLALATLIVSGWRRLLTGGLAALVTVVLGFLPFIITGRGPFVVHRLLYDLHLMPYTTVNGHNLWWLIAPWQRTTTPMLGPITSTQIGLVLFGLAYLAILWRLWVAATPAGARRPAFGGGPAPLSTQGHWLLAMVLVGYSFFAFSTHMHENHLFAVLPFLLLLAGRNRRWLLIALLAALSIFINMALHDIKLANELWVKIGGASGYYHIDMHRNLSHFEFGLANVNSVATLVIYGCLLWWGYRMSARRRRAPRDAA